MTKWTEGREPVGVENAAPKGSGNRNALRISMDNGTAYDPQSHITHSTGSRHTVQAHFTHTAVAECAFCGILKIPAHGKLFFLLL